MTLIFSSYCSIAANPSALAVPLTPEALVFGAGRREGPPHREWKHERPGPRKVRFGPSLLAGGRWSEKAPVGGVGNAHGTRRGTGRAELPSYQLGRPGVTLARCSSVAWDRRRSVCPLVGQASVPGLDRI